MLKYWNNKRFEILKKETVINGEEFMMKGVSKSAEMRKKCNSSTRIILFMEKCYDSKNRYRGVASITEEWRDV